MIKTTYSEDNVSRAVHLPPLTSTEETPWEIIYNGHYDNLYCAIYKFFLNNPSWERTVKSIMFPASTDDRDKPVFRMQIKIL